MSGGVVAAAQRVTDLSSSLHSSGYAVINQPSSAHQAACCVSTRRQAAMEPRLRRKPPCTESARTAREAEGTRHAY